MTGLSRCGKKYATFDEAVKAAEAIHFKGGKTREVVSCDIEGSHFHLKIKGTTLRSYHDSRPDPFPPAIRSMILYRDECCQRCGKYGVRLEAHHRRAKASGGSSARSHTQCACNGVMLCRRCHEWVHLNPRSAKALGLIVLQSVSRPGTVRTRRFSLPFAANYSAHPDEYPYAPYPTCDGGWNDQP